MSILIIRGPGRAPSARAAVPRSVVAQRVERVGHAGSVLVVRGCGRERETIDSIARARDQHLEFVLRDRGSAWCCNERFRAALERLGRGSPSPTSPARAGTGLLALATPSSAARATIPVRRARTRMP